MMTLRPSFLLKSIPPQYYTEPLEGKEVSEYRSVSLYPDVTELWEPKKKSLPVNIVQGAYDSVSHYLNTHFWLLREDFMKPIRENFRKFYANPNERLIGIKVHEVHFIRTAVKNENVCCCAELKRSVTGSLANLVQSKRFMIGSLVIFTNDGFKTIFCGRIVCNANLSYRKFLVTFEKSAQKVSYGTGYLMIECDAFFEPYYNVLKVIRGMNVNCLAMKRYLVDGMTDVRRPQYMRQLLLKNDPGLNHSQNAAMEGALSQELAIIQGPPGTGKTFLGLEIARTLLSLRSCWYETGPMLVISFTNHALDQFLQGLTGATTDILRYGGQSKNPTMKKYSLRERRLSFYDTKTQLANHCRQRIAPLFREFNGIRREIESLGRQMDNILTNRPTCIIYFDVLEISNPKISLWFDIENRDEMVCWLLKDDGSMGEELPSIGSGKDDFQLTMEVYNKYLKGTQKNSPYCMVSVSMMKNAAEKLYTNIMEMMLKIKSVRENASQSLHWFQKYVVMKRDMKHLQEVYAHLLRKTLYLKHCLSKLKTLRDSSMDLATSGKSPFDLLAKERWCLYGKWLNKYEIYSKTEMNELMAEHRSAFDRFEVVEKENNLILMRQQKVIGMTTTTAARMHSVIKQLKCPIVIVEEAAEVLESHIIPVLTEHCQHLILIGDHKQLKPSTADYDIETKHRLGVSLFERMVNNGMPCFTLNVQHRMRPEISKLITPTIYPVLNDHDSVTKFEPITGMEKNIYFITHKQPEESSGQSSKKNIHEARFFMKLAIYLISNGHKAEEITILAAYLGQVAALMQEQRRCSSSNTNLANVKITSVDNFQGEENKIILLSLVRNNNDGTIGFLSIENRVCVALSRAKEGLYVMGNIDQLTAKSELWKKIKQSLENQNAIGPKLFLKCQRHQTLSSVKCPDDFDEAAPNGGCTMTCNVKLSCGHYCIKPCHNDDLKHSEYKCMKPCSRSACNNPTHKCVKLCHQPCGLCMQPLKQEMDCGHRMKCFMQDLEDNRCRENVYIRLSCGHKKELSCFETDDSYYEKKHHCDKCNKSQLENDLKSIVTDMEHLALTEPLNTSADNSLLEMPPKPSEVFGYKNSADDNEDD